MPMKRKLVNPRLSIQQRKLRPYIGRDGFWNGHTAIGRAGERMILSDEVLLEMRRMNDESYWGRIPVKLKTLEQLENERLRELRDILERVFESFSSSPPPDRPDADSPSSRTAGQRPGSARSVSRPASNGNKPT